MKNIIKKSISVFMCILMILSCLNVSVFTEIGALIAQAADSSLSAGDINGDGTVNNKDLTRLLKHIAGEDVEVISQFLDTNGDGTVNNKDLTRLLKHIAGEDVIIHPIGCIHELEAVEAVEPTCTENGNISYWQCKLCGDLFNDDNGTTEITTEDIVDKAKGHSEEIIPAVAPTYDDYGSTEGVKCSVCDTIIIEPKPVEPLEKNEVYVTYYLTYVTDSNGNRTYDSYLDEAIAEKTALGIKVNPNGDVLNTTEKACNLDVISPDVVPGYSFQGWTYINGENVMSIPKGTTGNIVLYAKWTKNVYKVTFDSPDVPWSEITYTVDTGATLTNPSWFGYTFVGWSENGKIVKDIPVGTTGNKRLHANWTSDRNKAVSKPLTAPEIIEDLDNNRYLFVYEIGEIENVPLNLIKDYGKSESVLEVKEKYEYSQVVNDKFIEKAATAVSNATTKTSSWTLSEDWNNSTKTTNEHEEEIGKTEGKKDTEGNTVGSKYYISNSNGGSTAVSSNSGGSSSTSSKVTTDTSTGISSDYARKSELDTSVDLSVEASVGAGYGPISAEVKTGVATNTSTHDEEAFNTSSYRDAYVGTYDESNNNSYWDTSSTASASWNTTNSYENSVETSKTTEVSSAISEVVFDRWGYSSTVDVGGGSSATNSTDDTKEETKEYVSTIEHSTEERTTLTYEVNKTYTTTGYYRLVTVGKLHVFAVVGYDVATKSYFTYTYSVLDSETKPYMDYSMGQSDFDDCENAILPFEVPYEVHEYISDVTARSDGLTIGLDGIVTEYKGNATHIVIPEYTTETDGTSAPEAVRVRGFEEGVFAGNTTIKSVSLPKYITEIPDGAFAGCTSLESVFGYSITSVGDNAFAGCTSLKSFTVDKYFNSIGTNAFDGVISVNAVVDPAGLMKFKTVNREDYETDKDYNEAIVVAESEAYNEAEAVALSIMRSGAKSITVDIAKLGSAFEGEKIVIDDRTQYLAIKNDNTVNIYNDLQIESNAKETYLGGMTFVGNADTPLILNSDTVTLSKVSVENAPGFALILKSDNTDLKIYDTITLSSRTDNAVISKNINIQKAASATSKMQLTGNLLVCGTLTDNSLLSFARGEVKYITADQFNSYLTSSVVTFNPNGGAVAGTTKTVYYGQVYGDLPVPTREHYSFLGWYTQAEGGTEITADTAVTALVNQTLYAHWSRNTYKVNFNANGGSVSVSSKNVESGATYGELPTPTRIGWTFKGWYTATSGGTQITSSSTVSLSAEQTLYARWQVNAYTVTWSNGTGYTITVKRTSSPNAGASTGNLTSPATVYYGDVLSVDYSATTGYSLGTNDYSLTITGNTSIPAPSVSPLDCTYTIKYVSVNGTNLGSTSVTHKFNSGTYTISAPAKSGYTTPGSQNVTWDAISKTITFTYGIAGVSNGTSSGTLCNEPVVTYAFRAEYQNRTANSVQVRVVWTSYLKAYNYTSYGQNIRIDSPVGSGNTQFLGFNSWGSGVNYNREATGYSNWITVSLNTTNATSVWLQVYYFQTNSNGTDMTANYGCYGGSYGISANIPAY